MENLENILATAQKEAQIPIRDVLIEWLKNKVGRVIGTHDIEELKNYMLHKYGVMRTVESLSREFRRVRSENVLRFHGLEAIGIKTESRENKYLIEKFNNKDTNLFGEIIN